MIILLICNKLTILWLYRSNFPPFFFFYCLKMTIYNFCKIFLLISSVKHKIFSHRTPGTGNHRSISNGTSWCTNLCNQILGFRSILPCLKGKIDVFCPKNVKMRDFHLKSCQIRIHPGDNFGDETFRSHTTDFCAYLWWVLEKILSETNRRPEEKSVVFIGNCGNFTRKSADEIYIVWAGFGKG